MQVTLFNCINTTCLSSCGRNVTCVDHCKILKSTGEQHGKDLRLAVLEPRGSQAVF